MIHSVTLATTTASDSMDSVLRHIAAIPVAITTAFPSWPLSRRGSGTGSHSCSPVLFTWIARPAVRVIAVSDYHDGFILGGLHTWCGHLQHQIFARCLISKVPELSTLSAPAHFSQLTIELVVLWLSGTRRGLMVVQFWFDGWRL